MLGIPRVIVPASAAIALCVTCIAAAATNSPVARPAGGGHPGTALRAAFAARLRRLRNFECRYTLTNLIIANRGRAKFLSKVDAKMRKGGFQGGIFTLPPGPYRFRARLSFRDGWLRVERKTDASTLAKELRASKSPWLPFKKLVVLAPSRMETLVRMSRHSRPIGTIAAPTLQLKLPLLWAAMLGSPTMRRWLTPRSIGGMQITPLTGGRYALLRTVAVGEPGHQTMRLRDVWTVAAKPALKILSFEVLYGKFAAIRVKCGGYRVIDGVCLPGYLSARYYDPSWGLVGGCNIGNIRWQVPAKNTKESLRIKFPAGAIVYDKRIGHTFEIGRHGSYLTDRQIYRMLRR